MKFELSGSIGRGRPKQTWKKQVENKMKKNGLVKEDASNRTKWRGVVKTMTIRNPPTPSTGTIPDPKMKWLNIDLPEGYYIDQRTLYGGQTTPHI